MQTQRGGISLRPSAAVFLACILLASCGQHTRVRRVAEAGETVALPACPSPVPPLPDQAASEGRYGVVLVGYTVETDGRVDEIELEDPHASPMLFAAVQRWLEECRANQSTTRPKRMSELFSFPPPDGAPPQETPMALADQAGITRPQRGQNCTPEKPPAVVNGGGTMTVEYVVHSNGRVGDVTFKGGDAPRALFTTIKVWLQSCPYTPATREGRPVAVSMVESFSFQRG
jgi:hypothetical protein